MSELPIISITQDANFDDEIDENDTNYSRNISDCHTDLEDIDSVNENNDMLAVVRKEEAALTDLEDCEASGDELDDISDGEEFALSITEFLDQGCVNESSNVHGDDNNRLACDTHCEKKSPSPSAFLLLAVADDQGGITDCEDLEGSGEEGDKENAVSSADEAIVLEGQNSIDIQDNVCRKKPDKFNQRAFEHSKSSSSSESDDGAYKFKPYKRHNKKNNKRSDDKSGHKMSYPDEFQRNCKRNSLLSPNGDEAEEMVLEASDVEMNMERSPTFPEINITFAKKEHKKGKKKLVKSTMLALPQNEDEAVTDVENLNSSDSEDEGAACSSKRKSIQLISSNLFN